MTARRIRVSSHGHEVSVWIYPTREAMLAAATRWNGNQFEPDTAAVTQAATGFETGRLYSILIRLYEGNLSTEVVCHEMHHAATAIYGDIVGTKTVGVRQHLNHHNETFAYLYSDLFSRLVDRLYALGYYPSSAI